MNAKDIKRIEDIQMKALGNVNNMVKLAVSMANKITNSVKAEGRYTASISILGDDHEVTNVFKRRLQELTGNAEVTLITLDNASTQNNTIYFPTGSAVALWNWEFTGQISDGMWENTRPYDHWRSWCNMNVKIGNARRSRNTSHRILKTGYSFGSLKECCGDRMLKYGRFGKAVGNDILNMGSEVRTIIEEFPNETFNLEEFKKSMIERRTYRNAEYYWRGLEQKHIDAYNRTTYTNKDLTEDIRNVKNAMKNIV